MIPDIPAVDTEYIILENIYNSPVDHPSLRQRDLAQIAGASLGMTNSILKRLAQKGLITIKKLNSRNIQYAITIEGINEIILRSYRYFKRTIKNVVFFKEILEDLVSRAKHNNINTVILVGQSDLDFIVEHACRKRNLIFLKDAEEKRHSNIPPALVLKIYAESIPEAGDKTFHQPRRDALSKINCFYLSHLIMKQASSTGFSALEN